MARQARFFVADNEVYSPSNQADHELTEFLEAFAALVATHEREACCSIVYGLCESDNVAQRTVDAIRARGQRTPKGGTT
jgi:hypothetical protein